MDVSLYPSERIDDLLTHNLKIIQSHEVFSFSMDAVLLAKFVTLPIRQGRVMDLCAGNGVIPLLLSTRTKAKIDGVEIQERLYEMAVRSARLNRLTDQIHMHHGDLKEAPSTFGHGVYDVVTCNPPYMIGNTGKVNENEYIATARHEIHCSLEDVVRVSAYLVKSGGKVAYVHRPSRFIELVTMMRKYRIEPKRIRFAHPKVGSEANMVLIEGTRDGKPDVKMLPPLIVYAQEGGYTQEIMDIYYGQG